MWRTIDGSEYSFGLPRSVEVETHVPVLGGMTGHRGAISMRKPDAVAGLNKVS